MTRTTRREPTPSDSTVPTELTDQLLAATARSILSCPADVDLLVDGVATALEHDDVRGVHDVHGSPTFACGPGSELARSAVSGRSALLTLASGLGSHGGAERGESLVLAGRLEVHGTASCDCCTTTHQLVGLRLNFALLTRCGDATVTEQQRRVPLEAFRSPGHQLNRGFLQRSAEHANDSHQHELRRAVSLSSGTRMADVLGVRLSTLSTRGVVVGWVDTEGAHRSVIDFPRPARTPAELGDLLRRELHAGLC